MTATHDKVNVDSPTVSVIDCSREDIELTGLERLVGKLLQRGTEESGHLHSERTSGWPQQNDELAISPSELSVVGQTTH